MITDVIVEDPRWVDIGIEELAEMAIAATLNHLSLMQPGVGVAVLACDDARISVLNADFRDKPTPTNVLSWPSAERIPGEALSGDPEIGDIAISFDTCSREAEAGGISLKSHATHLIVHGTLHLLGYGHEDAVDADLMESTEIAILAELGVSNPYER